MYTCFEALVFIGSKVDKTIKNTYRIGTIKNELNKTLQVILYQIIPVPLLQYIFSKQLYLFLIDFNNYPFSKRAGSTPTL